MTDYSILVLLAVIITIVALATRAYLNFEQELQWETHQQGNGKIKVDAGLFSYEVDEKTYFKNWGRFEFMIELLLALLWLFPFILLAYLSSIVSIPKTQTKFISGFILGI